MGTKAASPSTGAPRSLKSTKPEVMPEDDLVPDADDPQAHPLDSKPTQRGRPRSGPAVARHLPRDEEILQIAAEVLLRNGLAGTKLDEIARRAGIAKGSLYHYFESKEQIYDRIIRSLIERVDRNRQEPPTGNPLEQLTDHLRQCVAVCVEHPVETAIVARHLVSMDSDVGRWAQQQRRSELQHLRRILLDCQRAGLVRPANVETLAIFMINSINGLAEWYRPDSPYSAEEISQDMIEFLLAGVGAKL